MTRDEKRAFWKFFLSYFISVALLILVAGYFYFAQTKQQLLKEQHFLLINYAKHIKTNETLEEFSGYSHEIITAEIEDFSIENFAQNGDRFEKMVPGNKINEYVFVSKSTSDFEEKSDKLLRAVVLMQGFLFVVFGFLSFFLAQNALKPLRQNIEKLDKFAKDLIHDLNTPVTAIGLNLKALRKEECFENHKALKRLEKSANEISDLHKNLTFLLRENRYKLEKVDLKKLLDDLLNDFQTLYPNQNFITSNIDVFVSANQIALRQILDNLLSNACKFNKESADINIAFDNNKLIISDSGIGIKNTKKIFQRDYTENLHGSGIGLDIVKRLCSVMDIKINIASSSGGTTVVLTFS